VIITIVSSRIAVSASVSAITSVPASATALVLVR
jgi:hypothetical protein